MQSNPIQSNPIQSDPDPDPDPIRSDPDPDPILSCLVKELHLLCSASQIVKAVRSGFFEMLIRCFLSAKGGSGKPPFRCPSQLGHCGARAPLILARVFQNFPRD